MRYWCFVVILLHSPCVFAQNTNVAADTAYLWRQAAGGKVIGQPSVQVQSVVTVLDGGSVKAYSSSGTPLWSFASRGRLCPYIVRSREGASYICGTNGVFVAINRTGRELWRIAAGGALSGPVALGWDGRLFVPTVRNIACYTVSGNPLWKLDLNDTINAVPRLDQGGRIVLALTNGDVMRVDPFGKADVWRLESSPRIILPVAGSSGPALLAFHDSGAMQMINPAVPGSPALDFGLLPAPPLAAASWGTTVAAALANGQMALLACADGRLLWTADSHVRLQRENGGAAAGNAPAAVIYDEWGIYMLTASGVTSFSRDGKRQWFTNLNNSSDIPALGDDGVLYSGGMDWILYAWKVEDRVARRGQTLYGPAPEGSYGLGRLPPSAFADYPGVFDETYINEKFAVIRQAVMTGRVGEYEREWTAWLIEVGAGGRRPDVFSVPRTSVMLTQRIRALQLLSCIGSGEVVPLLALLFKNEAEPLIRAAAAEAIGRIGIDPDGAAMREFLAAAQSAYADREEQTMLSVAAAAGALCRFSGPPLFAAGSRVLRLLTEPKHSSIVQRQARRELNNLR